MKNYSNFDHPVLILKQYLTTSSINASAYYQAMFNGGEQILYDSFIKLLVMIFRMR